MPTPCTRFPVGSSARLESRGVEFSERRGRISQISQLASLAGSLASHGKARNRFVTHFNAFTSIAIVSDLVPCFDYFELEN